MGARPGCGRTETAVDESRKETADRVARYQTDNIVGRTCCGCLEGAFVELRFSCPFLSLLVVFYYVFALVLFCFVCHISGGAQHLFFCFVLI